MENQLDFRIAFGILFFAGFAIRIYFHRIAGTHMEPAIGAREPPGEGMRRIIWGLILLASMVVYIFAPQWLAWSSMPMPDWLRWSGAGVGGLGLLLLIFVQLALGKNFSTTLRIRNDHTLVTHGLYRTIRHPMYTALILLWSGFVLLSANWFIGLQLLAGISGILRVRIPLEESMMIEVFGDSYREYMQRTGRLLPKWRRRQVAVKQESLAHPQP